MHKFLIITNSDDTADIESDFKLLENNFEIAFYGFKNNLFAYLKNRTDIDIIILDITPNNLTTLDICRQIRALQLTTLQIPILVLKKPRYKLQFDNIEHIHTIDHPISIDKLYKVLIKLDASMANILKKHYLN